MGGISYLPRDLIIEILSRIPVKMLCRFRSVCKLWQELLTSDKDFMARQSEWSMRFPLLLARRYLSDGTQELNNNRVTVEFTSLDLQGDVSDRFEKIIDGPVYSYVSCGSLSVLCCMYSLYVCNPCIRQLVRVPRRSTSRLNIIGFGYLPASDEYKIVHLFHHSLNGKMSCEIFSFRRGQDVNSGSWRQIGDCPFNAWTDNYPVCVNGVIYWPLSSGWKEKSILSLDLKEEEFSRISHPIHESKRYTISEYIGLMGSLCVVGFSAEASSMDVWMLKTRNKTWVLEYSVNLFPLCPKFLICTDDHSEEVVIRMEQRDLIRYSLKSQKSTSVGYYRATKNYNKPSLYYGSLVPLCTSGKNLEFVCSD